MAAISASDAGAGNPLSLIPTVDVSVLDDLERHTHQLSDSLERVTDRLESKLHEISAVTAACNQTFDQVVAVINSETDEAVKFMFSLMAHCEEMDLAMVPVQQLHQRIKRIKAILPVLEARAGISRKT